MYIHIVCKYIYIHIPNGSKWYLTRKCCDFGTLEEDFCLADASRPWVNRGGGDWFETCSSKTCSLQIGYLTWVPNVLLQVKWIEKPWVKISKLGFVWFKRNSRRLYWPNNLHHKQNSKQNIIRRLGWQKMLDLYDCQNTVCLTEIAISLLRWSLIFCSIQAYIRIHSNYKT